jgi:hypothetical protein
MGSSWTNLNAAASLTPRSQAAMTFDSQGYLHISGGVGPLPTPWSWYSDNWRSTYSFNNIQQWLPIIVPSAKIPNSYCNYVAPGSNGGGHSSLSAGGIAGAVVGSVVGFALLVVLICCFCFGGAAAFGSKKKTTSGDGTASHGFDRHEDSVQSSAADSTHPGDAVQMEEMSAPDAGGQGEAHTGAEQL